jgi:two-component system, cell cycle sensor histidine kinase and response regulator CckA
MARPVAFSHGLGLSLAYSIVAQCGGFMHASASPDAGTVFEILLPRVYRFRTAAEPAALQRAIADDAPLTVLLVEDEDAVRRIVHNHMERAGYNLLEASNAEEARDLAEVYDGAIHVLVTDIVLPGMSGRDLADQLRRVRPELKVLMVSGFPRNARIDTGIATGYRFLAKPFTASRLLESVRSLVEEEIEAK